MKKLIIIVFIFALISSLFGQTDTAKYYKLSDTTFWVGKTYILSYYIHIMLDGNEECIECLDSIVTFLNKNPKLTVEIGYHTESRQIPMTNDTLSLRLANSIKEYLVYKGISTDRVIAKGYGSKEPRIIYKDISIVFYDPKVYRSCPNKAYFFKKNTVLDDNFIKGLPDNCFKELAHHLNTRTQMKIIKNK
jgi:peptidoglycan-associated lipoprotein